jgi:hypothetical protein
MTTTNDTPVAQGELLPPAESRPIAMTIDIPKPIVQGPNAPVVVQIAPGGYEDMDKQRAVLLQQTIPPIASIEERDQVNTIRLRALEFIRTFKPKFDDVCRDAKSAHTKACELREMFIGGVERFEQDCARRITEWNSAQERERRRLELEAQAKAQAEEKARMEEEAKLRARMGDKEGAKAIRAMPVQAPPVVTRPAPPKTQGLTMRTDWKWRPVTGDTPEGRAMAEKIVPRAFMTIDDKKLNAHAETTKGQVPVPGIEFYSVDVPVRR